MKSAVAQVARQPDPSPLPSTDESVYAPGAARKLWAVVFGGRPERILPEQPLLEPGKTIAPVVPAILPSSTPFDTTFVVPATAAVPCLQRRGFIRIGGWKGSTPPLA